MSFKLAIVLLSALVQTAVLAESTSSRLGRTVQIIKAGGDGDTHANHLRKATKVQDDMLTTIALLDGDNIDKVQDVRALRRRRRRRSRRSRRSRGDTKIGDDEDENREDWNHGTYEVAAKRRDSIEVCAPSESKHGDTLFLFLSSSGGHLPLQVDQWTRGAECFKSSNKQQECFRASHCVEQNGPFCVQFRNGNMGGGGNDLGTVMFYRRITDADPRCWVVDLKGGNTWAMVTAITNVKQDPIRDFSNKSCDNVSSSQFPSAFGEEHDVLLLSQSFDDAFAKDDFTPPSGASRLGYMRVNQDAGFLFGEEIGHTGETGSLRTGGRGGELCKDALLSVVVNRSE